MAPTKSHVPQPHMVNPAVDWRIVVQQQA